MAEDKVREHFKRTNKTVQNLSSPRDIQDYSSGKHITIIVFYDYLKANYYVWVEMLSSFKKCSRIGPCAPKSSGERMPGKPGCVQ